MAGRFIDVLSRSFWLPDPGDVSQLASSFGAIENNLGETQQQVQALRSPESWTQWTGRAAGVFASQLSTVPDQISQAHEAYATVAAALSSYSAGLYPVHSAILSLVTEGEEAQTSLQTELAELSHARQTGDHAAVTYWTSRVDAAEENVTSLGTRLTSLYEEMNGLAETCARKINQAQHDGMQRSLFGDIEHDAGDVLFGTFVKPFVSLKSDWEKGDWGDLLQDLGDAVGVIALVVGLAALSVTTFGIGDVAIGGLTLGDAAVFLGGAPGTLGAADYLSAVALGLHIDSLSTSTADVLEHEPGSSWIKVSNSALSVVSDGSGFFIRDAAGAVFSVGSSLETAAFIDGLTNELSAPAVTPQTPDVVGGLLQTSGSLQGLQGLPVITASPESASVLQPAVGVTSPATVSIQRVSISQEVGIQ